MATAEIHPIILYLTLIEIGCLLSIAVLDFSDLPKFRALKKLELPIEDAKRLKKRRYISFTLYLIAAATNVPQDALVWLLIWLGGAWISHLTLRQIETYIKSQTKKQ